MLPGGVVALTQDWPDGPFDDVQCEALYLAQEPTALVLNCIHPDTIEPVEVRMRLPEDTTEEYFAEFLGNQDLRASFFVPPPESIGCILCLHASLRDESGELILLGYSVDLYTSYPAEGVAFDVGRAGWLRPGTPEYDAWIDPFGDLVARNVGCAERESLRPGSDVEIPLALQFTADDGLVSIYDRNEEYGVEVAGQRFDIRVDSAFYRGPLTCGDCPVTEVTFVVLRSPPA
jgi:hypothetical protein